MIIQNIAIFIASIVLWAIGLWTGFRFGQMHEAKKISFKN